MSFGINLSRFIYNNIIFKHKDSFSNDMITENDFNFNSIKDIQNETNNNFINLFLLMTKNSYITKDKFIKQIDDNIEKIKEYYDKKYILSIVLGENCTKSNFWISLYTMYRLHEKYNIFVKYAYTQVPEVLDKIQGAEDKCNEFIYKEKNNSELKKEKILLIISDDISYSGTQLSMHIRGNCYDLTFNETKEKTIKRKVPDNFTFFLNIISCTQVAYDKFKYVIEPENERNYEDTIIIPKNRVPTLKEFLLNICLNSKYGDNYEKFLFENDLFYLEEVDSKYYLGSMFKLHFNNLDVTLTYLPFKYPNSTSAVQNICGIFLNNGKILSYKDLDKLDNLEEINKKYNEMINNNSQINYNPFFIEISKETYDKIKSKTIFQEKIYLSFSQEKCSKEKELMKDLLTKNSNFINIKLPECDEMCSNFTFYSKDIFKMYGLDTKNILFAYKKSKN